MNRKLGRVSKSNLLTRGIISLVPLLFIALAILAISLLTVRVRNVKEPTVTFPRAQEICERDQGHHIAGVHAQECVHLSDGNYKLYKPVGAAECEEIIGQTECHWEEIFFSACGGCSTGGGPAKGTIKGYKVLYPSNQPGSPASGQAVFIDGTPSTTANPYIFNNVSATQHNITVSVPLQYIVGYTLCYNATSCHNQAPTPGSSTEVSVPANGYADLWWHYAPELAKTCSLSLSKGIINEGEGVTGNYNGDANRFGSEEVRFWVEQEAGKRISPAPGTEGYYGGRYYYRMGSCLSSNLESCSSSVAINNLPAGKYKVHCDLPADPGKCSGNPFCSHEGGPDNCTGWKSCSSSDNASLIVKAIITPTTTPSVTPPPVCNIAPLDIMLTLDRSGSMSKTENGLTRLQYAKTAAIALLDSFAASEVGQKGDVRIGVTFFGETYAYSNNNAVNPTTRDSAGTFTATKNKINSINNATGNTCIECGVKVANERLDQVGYNNGRPTNKMNFLLSDGRANMKVGDSNVYSSTNGKAGNPAILEAKHGKEGSWNIKYYGLGYGPRVATTSDPYEIQEWLFWGPPKPRSDNPAELVNYIYGVTNQAVKSEGEYYQYQPSASQWAAEFVAAYERICSNPAFKKVQGVSTEAKTENGQEGPRLLQKAKDLLQSVLE